MYFLLCLQGVTAKSAISVSKYIDVHHIVLRSRYKYLNYSHVTISYVCFSYFQSLPLAQQHMLRQFLSRALEHQTTQNEHCLTQPIVSI